MWINWLQASDYEREQWSRSQIIVAAISKDELSRPSPSLILSSALSARQLLVERAEMRSVHSSARQQKLRNLLLRCRAGAWGIPKVPRAPTLIARSRRIESDRTMLWSFFFLVPLLPTLLPCHSSFSSQCVLRLSNPTYIFAFFSDARILLRSGTGDSGKSTFAKQMKIIYKGGFTESELENYATLLISRSLFSMRALIRACKQLKVRMGKSLKVIFHGQMMLFNSLGLGWESSQCSSSRQVSFAWYARSLGVQSYTGGLYAKFWISTRHKRCLVSLFQNSLFSSPSYLDNVDRFVESNFVPTNQDVLKVRQKTSGWLLLPLFRLSWCKAF